MKVKRDVPLAPLTTLRLGGPAARLVEPETEEELIRAILDADRAAEPVLVLGGGSNVVVGDGGWPGLVVRTTPRGVDVRQDGSRVLVDARCGEPWDGLVERAVGEGWSGIECISGVPGLVGATPIQNVGAYGQEVRETLVSLRALDRDTGRVEEIAGAECGFGYRRSRFKGRDRWTVLSVRFAFEVRADSAAIKYPELARALGIAEGARAPLREVRAAVIALRRSKGMVLDPDDPDSVSAGSFFVNPVVSAELLADVEARAGGVKVPRFPAEGGMWKLSSGWLVEQSGFVKGFRAGPVGVSAKHALALVHRGGGSARELLALARRIRDGVRARFGVELEPEPVIVEGPGSSSARPSGP